MLELEILDPGRTAFGPGQLIRPFGNHPQAKVLQHRQQVGDGHRIAELDDFQVHADRDLPDRPVQAHPQGDASSAQRFQVRQILRDVGGFDILFIRKRKCLAVAVGEQQPRGLAALFDQRLAQPVRPGRRGLRDALFDDAQIDFAPALRIGANDDMHAGVIGSGDLYVGLDARAVETGQHDVFDSLPDLRVVAVARYVDETRVETMERVAAREDAHRAPLVEVHYSSRDANEIVDPSLKQLIAGIGFENVLDCFAVVARRVESEVSDDPLDLSSQHRNIPWTAEVGARGPQSKETVLADGSTLRVESLDPDVVEIFAAVDGCDRVGLRNDQQFAIARPGAHVAAQFQDASPFRSVAAGAQEPQAGLLLGHQAILGGAAFQAAVAVAEKDEMPLLHPAEQVACFADLIRRQRRRILVQRCHQLADPRAHGRPVLDDDSHVRECGFDVLLELLDPRRIGLPVDLVQLPRLGMSPVPAELGQTAAAVPPDFDDRMHDQMDGELGPAEDDAHRVDQEGHVVGDDHDQGMRRLEAIAGGVRIEHPHPGLAGHAPRRAHFEVGLRHSRQQLRRAAGEIFLADAAEVGLNESLSQIVSFASVTANSRRGGYLPDESDAGSRNAAQKPAIVLGRSGCMHESYFPFQIDQQRGHETCGFPARHAAVIEGK